MPAVHAHITMLDPVPINHPQNPFASTKDTDYSAPISAAKYPCKGYHKADSAALKPVATWQAGSTQKFTLSAGAVHGGGSCQASISEDGGQTFKVLKSYIGDCPTSSGGTFDFNVPKETKSGLVLFAWTWFNKIGNREMYMNCASVEITGGSSGLRGPNFPHIFLANIDNKCTTLEGADVLIPNPGPNVRSQSSNTKAPTGTGCEAPTGPAPEEGGNPENTPPPPPPGDDTTPPPTDDDATPPPPPPQSPTNGTTTPPQQPQEPVIPPTNDTTKPPPHTPPPTGSCTNGQVICTSATTWSLCANGTPIPMGNVASGTKCVNGSITKRSAVRFSADHMARRF
ncbi:hypothetical protein BDZ91DRAFT_649095 [Kalaharituber pfeilii]|nr:hypothetical protein BDZ91DRAFT_649095 [Kalaharituber pfeilii]